MRNSIQTRFLVGFVVLFTVTFTFLGFASIKGLPFSPFNGWMGNARQAAVRNLNLVADLRKERLTTWLRARQGDAQVVANNEIVEVNLAPLMVSNSNSGANNKPLSSANKEEAFRHIYAFLVSVQKAYEQHGSANYDLIRIVDAETGRVLVSTNVDETGTIAEEHGKYGSLVVHSGFDFVGDIGSDEHNPTPHIVITHPIIDPKERVVGYVMLELALEDVFNPLLPGYHGLGETGEVLFVDQQSRILTPLRHRLEDGTVARVLEYQIAAEPAVFAAAGREGVTESKDYRGQVVIAAYRYMRISPNWGWGLVVKIDKSELLADMNQSLRYSIWIGGMGVLLVIVVSLILTRQFTKPLRHMIKVAARLAGGDRSARTHLKTEDEIGELSSAFDSMAAEIEFSQRDLERRIGERTTLLDKELRERKQAEKKIQKLNVNLEKRVASRTAELSAVNKELESFAYSVAHDLRAPLRAIDGFSKALIEDHAGQLDDVAKQYLGYCRHGCQDMSHLIDDLLKLSQATRGEVLKEDFDLSQLTAEIVEGLKQGDPDRSVVTDIIPAVMVNADRRLLRSVMENLLGNAWKFTAGEEQAVIKFGAECVDGRVHCFVRDNGVGFDMAYQNKLFEPFKRLHSKDDFEGTGIGLATVQRIIHRHGSTIAAEGSVGEGACFTFELDPPEHAG